MAWGKRLALLAPLVFAAACSDRTYVVITFNAGQKSTSIIKIDLEVQLDGRVGRGMVREPGGGAITLPTDASLELPSGGAFVLTAVARDAGGAEIDRGTTSTQVIAGTVNRVTLSFSGGGADMASSSDLSGEDLAGQDLSFDLTPPPPDLRPQPDLAGTVALTLTSQSVGGGTGTVTTADGQINCGATCGPAAYAPGTVVVLTATPAANFFFGGWAGDGSCTGGVPTCSVTMNAAHAVTAKFTPANRMFVTSGTFVATALGGLLGADAICAAAASGKVPGTNWVAWLSSSTTNAVSRLVVNKNPALGPARGWVRPDGKPFADTVTALTQTGQIFYPPRIDETGVDRGIGLVTTATLADGTKASLGFCNDWTSGGTGSFQVGEFDGSTGNWTEQGAAGCSGALRLYCFGVDYTATVTPARASGRTAFLTSGIFQPGPGKSRATADAMCASEAAGAGLSGTYLAFMATSTLAASARFPAGTPWVRPDGIQVVDVSTDMFVTPYRLRATINVSANGLSYYGRSTAYTGGPDQNSTTAGPANTCNDWTDDGSAATANRGIRGDASLSGFFFYDGTLPCNQGGIRVYCLQQ